MCANRKQINPETLNSQTYFRIMVEILKVKLEGRAKTKSRLQAEKEQLRDNALAQRDKPAIRKEYFGKATKRRNSFQIIAKSTELKSRK